MKFFFRLSVSASVMVPGRIQTAPAEVFKATGHNPDAVPLGEMSIRPARTPPLAIGRLVVPLPMSCATLDLTASYAFLFVSEKQNDFSNFLQHR